TTWQSRMGLLKNVKIFQSHGNHDELLSFAHAKDLNELMVSEGLQVEFVPFQGGHEIPPIVIERAKAFFEDACEL
ncbi:MAG: hypothetical protein R2827_12245, partial [Bdellovibrionales bacterium]